MIGSQTICSNTALLGDPQFPNVAMNQSKGGIITSFENFYKLYSRMALSVRTDRPVAISGLEKRLIKALGVHGGYGIFDSRQPEFSSYLRRSLLWQRDSSVESMRKIEFSMGKEVPSWSWMSYEGPIDYLHVPFNRVDWEKEGIQSPWHRKLSQESSWHTVDRAGNGKLIATAHGFSDSTEDETVYDIGTTPSEQELKCVVIGWARLGKDRSLKDHYVLLIGKQMNHEWKRVGVGILKGKSIAFEMGGTTVQIN